MTEATVTGQKEGAGCGLGHVGCHKGLGFTPSQVGAMRFQAEEALIRSRFNGSSGPRQRMHCGQAQGSRGGGATLISGEAIEAAQGGSRRVGKKWSLVSLIAQLTCFPETQDRQDQGNSSHTGHTQTLSYSTYI